MRDSASGNSSRALTFRPVLVALAICAGSGSLLAALHAPLPWMIGPLLAMALFKVLGASVAPLRAEPKELKVRQAWDGIIGNEKLLKEAPPTGKPL